MVFISVHTQRFLYRKSVSPLSCTCPCRPKCLSLRRVPRACTDDEDIAKPRLPDFNRDYYDSLKAQYANDPYVHIYSKEDYKLDPKDVPWLYDCRGRDIKEIKEKVRKRMEDRQKNPQAHRPPEHEDGHEDAPPNALIWTDLHTEQEISEFPKRALTEDPVSGRVWSTPITKSQLYTVTEQYETPKGVPPILFDDEEPMSKIPFEDPDMFWENVEPPLPGNLYDESDELIALNRSWEHMHEQIEARNVDHGMTFGEMDLVPDPAEYERWKREAEKRGGNATVGDSHFLSPYGTARSTRMQERTARRSDEPLQHDCLVRTHVGLWDGTITVYQLEFGDRLQHSITMSAPMRSEVIHDNDGSLQVHCTVDREGDELLSSTEFSVIQSGNVVCRGRGVNHDGSYILIPPKGGFLGGGFSVSEKTLSSLTGDLRNKPVVELCLFTSRNERTRHRIFLFADGLRPEVSEDEKFSRRASKATQFSAVILISENFHDSPGSEPPNIHSSRKNIPAVPLKSLLGQWNGRGTSLHPEYPLECHSTVTASFSMKTATNILESDVTWTEDKFENDPTKPPKRQNRQLGKKSKRITAARNHDLRRLSLCSVLSREQTGDVGQEEVHPWEISPSPSFISSLFSPRIGRFVPDYCGIVLKEDLILTLPFQTAYPTIWNTITVMEIGGQSRMRVTAGRSPENLLVGALFVKEKIQDNEASDSVAGYV